MKEYCVSCAKMKILEQNTDAAGLSYYQMMENAGTIAANRIIENSIISPINDALFGSQKQDEDLENGISGGASARRYAYQLKRPLRARVFTGKGNNGGDGFVVARKLSQHGWTVDIVLVDGDPVTPDAVANWKIAADMKIPMRRIGEEAGQAGEDAADSPAHRKDTIDVVVDAIYGTGFHGRLRENGAAAAAQISALREEGARVCALDIPSGMGGDLLDRKELDERCVKADMTITFHAKKPVHLQPFAAEYCGRVITADIGIVDEDLAAYDREKTSADGSAGGQSADAGKSFDLEEHETYSFEDFVEIISRLRAPDGCPWDRAQTHETLKKYLLEETQEAADAIDHKDDANFCEELGDVLLQIVLNAQLAKERGVFTIEEVIQGISEKMIRRHPWVFGDMKVDSPEEGERLWQEIKKKEKA